MSGWTSSSLRELWLASDPNIDPGLLEQLVAHGIAPVSGGTPAGVAILIAADVCENSGWYVTQIDQDTDDVDTDYIDNYWAGTIVNTPTTLDISWYFAQTAADPTPELI